MVSLVKQKKPVETFLVMIVMKQALTWNVRLSQKLNESCSTEFKLKNVIYFSVPNSNRSVIHKMADLTKVDKK